MQYESVLGKTATEPLIVCRKCGVHLYGTENFCPKCGRKLERIPKVLADRDVAKILTQHILELENGTEDAEFQGVIIRNNSSEEHANDPWAKGDQPPKD